MASSFRNTFQGLPVLVTGHTGFKGSWLSIWLNELGAQVVGYSQEPPTVPSNFELSRLGERIKDVRGDIRDLDHLRQTLEKYQPRVVFHLAAQSNVLRSFEQPKLTVDTNCGGTVNVLEAVRTTRSVRAVVSITSDKCYENKEWYWGYRENDALGGHDLYSASKTMAEAAIAAYRSSFFPADRHKEHGVALASCRAGNVIGGGDLADFRLVPDCMRALLAGEPVVVRNPASVRPWQHALEPLSGYLWLAANLLEHGCEFAEAWNFGPLERQGITAQAIAEKAIDLWGAGKWVIESSASAKTETGLLRLNWDKAANRLNWRSTWTWEEALSESVDWFKTYQSRKSSGTPVDMYDVCVEHIRKYTERARELNVQWAK